MKVALRVRPIGNLVNPIQVSEFDYFYVTESQGEIYDKSIKSMIEDSFNGNLYSNPSGYNVCIFAYGQTGSGKTYTMGFNESNSEATGIAPRVLEQVFSMVSDAKLSFLEIYKEQIFDLLPSSSQKEINVMEFNGEIKAPGLSEVKVNNFESALQCLQQGIYYRKSSRTSLNDVSSRSHAIFSIKFERKLENNRVLKSKICLIDLAGSERLKNSHLDSIQFQESVKINAGLLALGNVIRALAEGETHVPFRQSKLTRFLQDALGGNSLSLMIACVNPVPDNREEMMNTMNYALKALNIKNNPVINVKGSKNIETLDEFFDSNSTNFAPFKDQYFQKLSQITLKNVNLNYLVKSLEKEKNKLITENGILRTEMDNLIKFLRNVCNLHKNPDDSVVEGIDNSLLTHTSPETSEVMEALLKTFFSHLQSKDSDSALDEKYFECNEQQQSLASDYPKTDLSESNMESVLIRNQTEKVSNIQNSEELETFLNFVQSEYSVDKDSHNVFTQVLVRMQKDKHDIKELNEKLGFYESKNIELREKITEFIQVHQKQVKALKNAAETIKLLRKEQRERNK